jgi:hypothetical protein
MLTWLRELDEVLRGQKADPHLLAGGTAHIPIQPLVVISIPAQRDLQHLHGVIRGGHADAAFSDADGRVCDQGPGPVLSASGPDLRYLLPASGPAGEETSTCSPVRTAAQL